MKILTNDLNVLFLENQSFILFYIFFKQIQIDFVYIYCTIFSYIKCTVLFFGINLKWFCL